jgi:hypothetical protein
MEYKDLIKRLIFLKEKISLYLGSFLFCSFVAIILFISTTYLIYGILALCASIFFAAALGTKKERLKECEDKLNEMLDEIHAKAINFRTELDVLIDDLEHDPNDIIYMTPDSKLGEPVTNIIKFMSTLVNDTSTLPVFDKITDKAEFLNITKQVHNKLTEIIHKCREIEDEIKEEAVDNEFVSSF